MKSINDYLREWDLPIFKDLQYQNLPAFTFLRIIQKEAYDLGKAQAIIEVTGLLDNLVDNLVDKYNGEI